MARAIIIGIQEHMGQWACMGIEYRHNQLQLNSPHKKIEKREPLDILELIHSAVQYRDGKRHSNSIPTPTSYGFCAHTTLYLLVLKWCIAFRSGAIIYYRSVR